MHTVKGCSSLESSSLETDCDSLRTNCKASKWDIPVVQSKDYTLVKNLRKKNL